MADDDMTSANKDLRRLNDLDDFQVADGYDDIRGWDVKTPDGVTIGKVDDLVLSLREMRVRYIEVLVTDAPGGSVSDGAQEHALLPIGAAELDDVHDDVMVSVLGSEFASYPRYSGREITRGYETQLRAALTGAAGARIATSTPPAIPADSEFYEHDHFEDQKLYAKRKRPRAERDSAGEQRMVLNEEQLDLGKRTVQQGEVQLRKSIDTDRVTEEVPLMHEEATVDRRPITDPQQMVDATIGGRQEISVPLMGEQAVVEKRTVVREEIVIRKRAVVENHAVEADLKRERLEVDDPQQLSTGADTSSGSTATSLSDAAADAVDDLSDRVDGDPASRPGRDATDRQGR